MAGREMAVLTFDDGYVGTCSPGEYKDYARRIGRRMMPFEYKVFDIEPWGSEDPVLRYTRREIAG